MFIIFLHDERLKLFVHNLEFYGICLRIHGSGGCSLKNKENGLECI